MNLLIAFTLAISILQNEATPIEHELVTRASVSNGTCVEGIPMCCMNLAPFYTNSFVWGQICGLNVPGNTIIGGRCAFLSPCPTGTVKACCDSFVPGQCSLGVNCIGY